MFYLFEVRDSDGNNCFISDAIVEAPTLNKASEALWEYLAEIYPTDDNDGGYGTFHACDCECEHASPVAPICDECSDHWECSHGGLLTNEDCGDTEYGPKEFATYSDARAARKTTYFHSLIELLEK
jgi:hypothetical protein